MQVRNLTLVPKLYLFSVCNSEWKQRLQDLSSLKAVDPQSAQGVDDSHKWHHVEATHYAVFHGPMHALGLHRDTSRGWTHIMFQELEHTPSPRGDFRSRIRVKRCGVFKVEDVLEDMEKLAASVDSARERFENIKQQLKMAASRHKADAAIPMFIFSYGQDAGAGVIRAGTWFLRYHYRFTVF